MTSVKKRLFILAGEASGDLHGAKLVQALHAHYPERFEITAIGGKHLGAQNLTLLHDLAQHGITGFSGVIRQIPLLKKVFRLCSDYLKAAKPDLVILIDYPGFNLRLARHIKNQYGLKILYYVSPQIWAWKAGRIKTIQACVDHMAVILPFEKPIYDAAKVPCTFVGHPILETLTSITQQQAQTTLNLNPNAPIVALLPGSRRVELKYHLPVLKETAKKLSAQFKDIQFIVPIASSLSPDQFASLTEDKSLNIRLAPVPAQLAMSAAHYVIVASGTASLECALLAKPMCIIYKSSFFSSIIVNHVVKIKYAGLCNLIANKMIVPELLQDDCTAAHIASLATTALSQPQTTEPMIDALKAVKTQLEKNHSQATLDELVYQISEQKESALKA